MASKREQILATALELFVTQGLGATATSQIARQAGVATGTLFHHFASKDDLVRQLYLDIKLKMAEAVRPCSDIDDPLERLRQFWDLALEWAVENPLALQFLTQVYATPGTGRELRSQAFEKVLRFVPELLYQGQQQGRIRAVNQELLLANAHAQFLASAQWLIQEPELARDPAVRQQSFELLWRGLNND